VTHETGSIPKGCLSRNVDGSPCSARLWKDSYCIWHHPDRIEQRREISAKGGKARSSAARAKKALKHDLRDMAGVKASLLSAIAKVEKGEMEPAILTAMATGARALVAVSGVADFEDQLAEMRQEIAALTGRRDVS
jgi:hypothetical protein